MARGRRRRPDVAAQAGRVMDLGLAGKVAVVTGASKGIGLAVTRSLIAEGARVAAGARNPDALAELDGVHPVTVDLTAPDGPARLVDEAVAAFGGIDILVNNVGAVHPRLDGFLAITDDDWEATLTVNFLAAVRTTRAALPHLLAAARHHRHRQLGQRLPARPRRDRLLRRQGRAGNFCKALSKELGPAGIRVNTVSPGPVETDLWLGDDGVAATVGGGERPRPRAVVEQAAAADVDRPVHPTRRGRRPRRPPRRRPRRQRHRQRHPHRRRPGPDPVRAPRPLEGSGQGTSRLRIGVLASIAHRTPPRGYGPWEQVASTLAEGLVALGHDVTLFATADSRTAARLHAEAPRGYEEDPGGRRQGVRGPAHRRGVRAGRRVRRDEQPVRLPAADLQPAGVDAGGDDHPRLLVGADRAGLPRLRRHRALRRDQRRGPPPGPDLRRDDPPRHRPLPLHLPGPARGLPAVPRPHPSRQGHPPGDRGRASGRAAAGHRRDRAGRGLLPGARRAAPRRRRASATSARSGRPSGTRCSAARWRCCTSSASPSRSGSRSSSRWPPAHR